MRIDTNDKATCCGCGACAVACPQACIQMRPDEEGFDYPVVDSTVCVECGKCLEVCGMQSALPLHKVEEVYAAWHTDPLTRAKGTSGSVASALADVTFRSGGSVAGAVFADDFKSVKHVVADSLAAAERFQGSKYVQSETRACFAAIVEKVRSNKNVLFLGAPCQVASLRRLAGGGAGLTTCDFVCHGVASPAVFRRYVTELGGTPLGDVVHYEFRNKAKGWNFPRRTITYAKGLTKRSDGWWLDRYMVGYYSNAFLRPCCYVCPFANARRAGDLTLADCWRVAASHPQYDDNKGTSLVLANTCKGRDLVQDASQRGLVFLGNYDLNLACNRNTALRHSSPQPEFRDAFFKVFSETGSFELASKVYIKCGFGLRKRVQQRIKYLFWPILRRFQ